MLEAARRAPRPAGAHPGGTLIAQWFLHSRLRLALGLARGLSSLLFRSKSQTQFYKWCSVKLDGHCQDFEAMRPRLKASKSGVLNSKSLRVQESRHGHGPGREGGLARLEKGERFGRDLPERDLGVGVPAQLPAGLV